MLFQAVTLISVAQSWPAQQAWIPAYLHATQVLQDDELTGKSAIADASEFYWNPLLVNGTMLDYNKFTISSRGLLSVAKGNPSNPKAEKIPFAAFIRRQGKIIQTWSDEKGIYEIDIEKLLIHAKSGDQLIIDPVHPKDWKAKRILKLLGGGC